MLHSAAFIFYYANPLNQVEIRTALSLALVYLLRMLGLFMVMPVLAILALDYPGYSALWVGIAIGGYGLTQAVLQIPAGVLSDRVGRKPVIIAGLLLFALGSLIAAQADSMLGLVVGRLIQGAGAIASAIMALASDVTRESQRPKVMAIIGVAIGFSFYLALILGPMISAGFGLAGVFAFTGIFALLAIPLVLFVVPRAPNLAPSKDVVPQYGGLGALARHPQLLRLNTGVLFLHLLITLVFVQIPPRLIALDWQLDSQWQFYLPVLLVAIVGLMLLMAMAARLGQKAMLILAVALMSVALFALVPVGVGAITLMALMAVFFTGFNFLEANFPAMVSAIAPPAKRGSAMGLYASSQFLGAFLGGLISGVLAQYMSADAVLIFGGALCVLWLPILAGMDGTNRLKRVTLALTPSCSSNDPRLLQVIGLPGIVEWVHSTDDNALYLKVRGAEFDLVRARKIIGQTE